MTAKKTAMTSRDAFAKIQSSRSTPAKDVSMSPASAHFRCFIIGAFFAAYFYSFDRCVNLQGPFSVPLLIVMTMIALVAFIAIIKVPRDSRFHLPLKPFTLLAGFLGAGIFIYAFFGHFPGKKNFIEQFAEGNHLPPALQMPLQKFLIFSSSHSALNESPAPKTAPEAGTSTGGRAF